jgi:hypothetical protein
MTNSNDPADVCRRRVATLAELTGAEWTFGYIGNVSGARDDRRWYAFAPHPGRVGTADDRIGGVPTEKLGDLATMLAGALALARVQANA